jgi:hypothetical protein
LMFPFFDDILKNFKLRLMFPFFDDILKNFKLNNLVN